MRIAIREQLTLLILMAALIGLAAMSIPTWLFMNCFIIDVKRDSLSLTAALKALRINGELELLQQSCNTIASRVLVQNALELFYNNEPAGAAWNDASDDILAALSGSTLTGLLQARIYSRNETGGREPLLSVTSPNAPSIKLPYSAANGSAIYLSDTPYGYPYSLYPNLTYVDLGRPNTARPNTPAFAAEAFPGVRVTGQGLLLGPLIVNSTYALLSLTVPIRDRADSRFILGYMTVVSAASSLFEIRDCREGLGRTGMVLVVGPTRACNRFEGSLVPGNETYAPPRDQFGELPVHFVIPFHQQVGQELRHRSSDPLEAAAGGWAYSDTPFAVKDYPAVLTSYVEKLAVVESQGGLVSTPNELGIPVAVGYARMSTELADWTVLVEQAREEAYVPIKTLRNILLGTVFGTVGFLLVVVFPCAHISVMPIRRLKEATAKTIQPPGYEDSYYSDLYEDDDDNSSPTTLANASNKSPHSDKGIMASVKNLIYRRRSAALPGSDHGRETTRRIFKIPGKVEDKDHFITDELTELTSTFNGMSDELVRQVTSLDQKVADRTRELEISKKAAEAANESKTLFIANISHELKTPLNGILGMCAICMEEDDIVRIQQSLKTLYKSGDLLLHLLEDLLSFSKNQIGQQLSLEEKEFRLADIRSQILTIFDKQVREGRIRFSVNFGSTTNDVADGGEASEKLPAIGPGGVGRLKDMCLWGDQHRVLQVIINLVSNSLKFTPAGGSVTVRIKCLGEVASSDDVSKASSSPRSSAVGRIGRPRHRVGSSGSINSRGTTASAPFRSNFAPVLAGTALSINPMDPKATPHVLARERSPSPPPANARQHLFEFEVEDTGPGIPEHMQHSVFEPFVQGDLGLSKKFGGTGLGLSICHQLASLMGGNITLRSAVGVGSTFTMRIPLRYVKDRPSSTASSSIGSRPSSIDDGTEPNSRSPSSTRQPFSDPTTTTPAAPTTTPATTPQSPPTPPNTMATTCPCPQQQPRLVGFSLSFFASSPTTPSSSSQQSAAEARLVAIEDAVAKKQGPGKLRVLVADDNSTNVEVVSRMLKLEDVVDVTIAMDGQEAYDKVKATMDNNKPFDLIFMDIQMPNLDGLQSTRLIRKMGYTSPIVALTAFSEESYVKECIESGMNEFLSKPIRRPALKKVLRKFATIPEEPETAAAAVVSVACGPPARQSDVLGSAVPLASAVAAVSRQTKGKKGQAKKNKSAKAAAAVAGGAPPTAPPQLAAPRAESPAPSDLTAVAAPESAPAREPTQAAP